MSQRIYFEFITFLQVESELKLEDRRDRVVCNQFMFTISYLDYHLQIVHNTLKHFGTSKLQNIIKYTTKSHVE